MPFLTDRTRITTYQTCPRLRFLTFHFGGRGLVPLTTSYELWFGIVYHDALAALLVASATPEDPDPDTRLITEAGTRLASMPPPVGMPPFWSVEQRYLLEGLLWAWVLTRRDAWRAQYEVVLVEQEFTWDLGSGITLMVRLDALLRDRTTANLYYLEQKTTAWGNEKWSATFTHNAQIMAGILACEQALKETPAGVIVEGHVKGPRRIDTSTNSEVSGFEFQDSPLCYLWQLPDGNVTAKWTRNARRVFAGTLVTTPRTWVESVLSPLERENCFRTLPPIMPDRLHLARWLRQTVLQEAKIRQALRGLSEADAIRSRELLDEVFPLHEGACEWQYGRQCSHWRFCHDQTVAGSPMETPGFAPRTPHHPAELEETRDGR